AHREGVRLTSEQEARGRARLLARAAGAAAATGAVGAASTTVGATTGHVAAALVIKVALEVAIVGGADAGYYVARRAPRVEPLVAAETTEEPAPTVAL